MRIDGSTRLVGLIGWPVEHSLSPVMHNAAFQALGLPWCYLPLPVSPGQVKAAVSGLAALGFRGANVTVPHKRSVVSALNSVGATAFGGSNGENAAISAQFHGPTEKVTLLRVRRFQVRLLNPSLSIEAEDVDGAGVWGVVVEPPHPPVY